MTKLILIDADILTYRCGFAVEKNKYLVTSEANVIRGQADSAKEAKALTEYDGDLTWHRKEVEPLDHALALVKNVIQDIQTRYYDCDGMRLWLTPSVGNFREQIATRAKYKGNRDTVARPVHHRAIVDYLCNVWGAQHTIGQEADDAIGIDMSSNEGSVCVSIDKDLHQLPGRHYNWVDKSERQITKREAALAFWSQVLSGDATDNIPGIEGIGPVKAAKLLEGVRSEKDAWEVVKAAYANNYGSRGLAFALETARLVFVRRRPEQNWEPPA